MIYSFTRLKIILPALLSVIYTLSYAQTGTLAGTILDSKKETVIGATVKVAGTSIGAVTDIDGKYTISNVPVGKQQIIISYVGMQAQTINVNVRAGETTVTDATMKDNDAVLNEVVVVGYGTQVKKDMSSSVSEVKSDVIGDKPVYDFTSALQGQAAGVQITTDNGLAGATTTVRIRGTKSLSNSAEPLYIIDGVPIISYDISNADATSGYNVSPLSNINPADIASVVVLKDAEATAIYGARGANGVIVVTTKKGDAGKSKVDVSVQAGISQPTHILSILNGPQYEKLYYEAWRNDSIAGAKIGSSPSAFTGFPNGITYANAANTNWLKQLLTTGHYEDMNFSVSGGDAKTTYYIGMGFRDDHSFMVGNKFQRASFRSNIDHQVNKYFSIGFNSSLTYTDNHYVPTAQSGGLGTAESSMLPIYPVYNPNGTYFLPNMNPVAAINLNSSENNTFSSVSDAYMEVRPIPGLTFRNEFGINMLNQLEAFYISPIVLLGDTGIATDRRDFYFTWNLNSTLDYKKEINENNVLDVLVGFNPSETTEKFTYVSQTDFPVSTFTQPQQGSVIISGLAGTGRQYAFASFFGRINYKLYKRFLLEFSLRDDGVSRYDVGHRWGVFPAGSAGWVISDERFFSKATKAMNFLKVRASVGVTGNSDMSTDWAFLSAYSGGHNYDGLTGIAPSNLPVPNLTWETTLKTDIGFDYAFLNSRISGAIDVYKENTTNTINSATPLTPSSGFVSTVSNVGALYNEGIEFNITSNNLGPKCPLKWKTTLNIATNKNKVTNLGNVSEVTGTNFGNNVAVVGQPVGVWLLAQYAGIDPQTGQMLIYDSTGKNKVVATASSVSEYAKPTGHPYPAVQGGITNTLNYMGFDLTVLFTYSIGNEIYDDDGKRQTGDMAFGWNQLSVAQNAWTTPGQITNIPILSLVQNYDLNTTRYLYNASFLRLRTLTFGYTLPSLVSTKIRMRSLRFYVSAQNLFVVTPYKGWDPETNRDNSGAITQGVSYLNAPQARIYSVGVNFGF